MTTDDFFATIVNRTGKGLKKGQLILAKTGADAMYVTAEYLQRYLVGFAAESGFVLIDKNGVTLYTDKRYLEAAKNLLNGTFVRVEERNKDCPIEKLLSVYKTVAIPKAETTVAEYETLQKSGVEFVDATPALQKAMAIKTKEELTFIKKACEIAETAFIKLLPRIKEGKTERQVAAMLEYEMKNLGADGTSFETIVAFGAHSAVPHHRTGDTPLKYGDVVLIDFGCTVEGYCSDMTRTFLYGDDGKKQAFKKAYAAVKEAHEKVLAEVESGMTAGEADAIARRYLEEVGFGDKFTHSLGHGIGLQIHEFPTLTKGRETVLKDGMVFSDEPGVYFEGEFGVRIEDTVTLQEGKIVSLTTTKKDLVIL